MNNAGGASRASEISKKDVKEQIGTNLYPENTG
jgi:hypothetical protein